MNQTSDRSAAIATPDLGVGNPKKGDRFRCTTCGMEVQVTADCHCEQSEMVHFHCCGKEMAKA